MLTVAIKEMHKFLSFINVSLILFLNISALRSHPGMMLMFPNLRLNLLSFARNWLVLYV